MGNNIPQMGYGTLCEKCSRKVGLADYYCRWCGIQLRDGGE